jgi:uncharacterized membrane protein YdcZ (DUF606 family)
MAQGLIQYGQIVEGRQGVCVLFAQQLFSKLQDLFMQRLQPHRTGERKKYISVLLVLCGEIILFQTNLGRSVQICVRIYLR